MLGTEKPFNVFFSGEGIHQDNGEREGYKRADGLHSVLLLNKRLELDQEVYSPQAFMH